MKVKIVDINVVAIVSKYFTVILISIRDDNTFLVVESVSGHVNGLPLFTKFSYGRCLIIGVKHLLIL